MAQERTCYIRINVVDPAIFLISRKAVSDILSVYTKVKHNAYFSHDRLSIGVIWCESG